MSLSTCLLLLAAGCTNGEASPEPENHQADGSAAGAGARAGETQVENGGRAGSSGFAVGGTNNSGAGASPFGGAGGAGASSNIFGQLACASSDEGNGVHEVKDSEPPSEWTLKSGVLPGKISKMVEYVSKTYNGYKFPYRIYTSHNYVDGEPALFLVFGDGGMYLDGAYRAATVLDNLTAEKALLPTVALFVDPGPNRVAVYDPPTDRYSRFLIDELINDVIVPNYSVSRDPRAWATVGYSASGEAGFAVVWHRPEWFQGFFGHSASFGASIRYDNWVWADKIAQAPKRELRVSLVVAAEGDLSDDRGSWRTINENVAKALAAKGNPYRLILGPGDHGGLASQQDFPKALRWMWQGCEFAN